MPIPLLETRLEHYAAFEKMYNSARSLVGFGEATGSFNGAIGWVDETGRDVALAVSYQQAPRGSFNIDSKRVSWDIDGVEALVMTGTKLAFGIDNPEIVDQLNRLAAIVEFV